MYEKLKNAILILVLVVLVFGYLLFTKVIPAAKTVLNNNSTYKTQVQTLEDKQRNLDTLKREAAKKANQPDDAFLKQFYRPIISGGNTEDIITDQFQDILKILRANLIKAKSIDYEYDPTDDAFVKNAADKYHVCRMKMELIGDYKSFERFLQDIYKHEHFIDIEEMVIDPYQKNKKILLINLKLKLYAQK